VLRNLQLGGKVWMRANGTPTVEVERDIVPGGLRGERVKNFLKKSADETNFKDLNGGKKLQIFTKKTYRKKATDRSLLQVDECGGSGRHYWPKGGFADGGKRLLYNSQQIGNFKEACFHKGDDHAKGGAYMGRKTGINVLKRREKGVSTFANALWSHRAEWQ